MNKHILHILIILFCIHTGLIHPEETLNLQFSQISTKDGLSQNTVRAILEDEKGFIWAGTLDGLNKYDGYNIVTYRPQLNNRNSLIDHRIKNVYQDRDGFLWIKTYNNAFCLYNPAKDVFIYNLHEKKHNVEFAYSNYYESKRGNVWLWDETEGCLLIEKTDGLFKTTEFLTEYLSKNKRVCRFLYEDSKSNIWIGGEAGLFSLNDNKQVKNYYKDKYVFTNAIEINNRIYFTTRTAQIVEYDLITNNFRETDLQKYVQDVFTEIVCMNDKELLIATASSGLFIFNTIDRSFKKPAWSIDKQLTGYISFIIDKNHGVWIYNKSGIMWYYNPENQKVKRFELIPPDVANIIDLERYVVFIDSKGLIWITTYGNGLFCYNPSTEQLSNYVYNPNRNSPASDYLLSITEDDYGNIWVGSEYAGIIKVSKSQFNFSIIRPEEEISIGKNNNVRTVYRDLLNKIWIGTKNGSLYVYNSDFTVKKRIYSDINPYALTEDAKNRIWIGTKGKGIYIIDNNTYKELYHFKNQSNDGNSISHNTIFSILRDSKDRMWVGTFGGGINLAEDSPQGMQFKSFFVNQGSLRYVRYLYQDSRGEIWAGTNEGIIRFNPDELLVDEQKFQLYQMQFGITNSLNCNDVKTIFEDEEGTIWIGTAGGGLNKYVPATADTPEHFIAYTSMNGLSGDMVSGILQDSQHNLWISTESGTTKFNKKNNSFMVYHFSDKTYGNHFNENANILSPNGNMLFGSLDGLMVFNPESFVMDTSELTVTLTNLYLLNQHVRVGDNGSPLLQSISYSDKIKLNYKQNTFSIEFSSLGLKDPLKNKYVYILENYDKQWSAVSHANTATYKNLPPGEYTFKVKGTNSEGVWNQDTTKLSIIIAPPFWNAWYAYVVYMIFLTFIVIFIFKLILRFNTLNNKIKVEKELTNHKLRFFTNISHEFRTPLTLIKASVENLNNTSNVSQQVKKYVNVLNNNTNILLRLIDQLLEFRKIQNNVLSLDLEETDLVTFSKEIFNSFTEIANQKSIQYTFTSKVEHLNIYLDTRKVDKILYNLLSNAFKFTSKNGTVELQISHLPEQQICRVSIIDTGIGIPKEKQELLFKRFMQINFSSQGTGVGLSLVKEFVDVHKAEIRHEDNHPQGAIFHVEFSTNKDTYDAESFIPTLHPEWIENDTPTRSFYPQQQDEIITLPEIDDDALSNYSLLIIEDNAEIRNFLVEEFSKYLMVSSAEDGSSGLQKAIESNPDLIICDVMMPEMDGFELTRRLKDDFQTCHIPIVLLTSHSSMEHQLEGIQSGADAYVIKPFSLKHLVLRVFKLIEQRELLKKRFSNEYVLDGNLISFSDKDKQFFELIDRILDKHIADSTFTVDKFAEYANQRRTLFYKKIKGITGMSPNELIKVKRLKMAAQLLLETDLTIAEISYKVGFEDPFYFSKCFKAHFNVSPSKFGQEIANHIKSEE